MDCISIGYNCYYIVAFVFVLPKVCTECKFLQLGGCSQVQSVALIAKTERLRDPESCAAETEIKTTASQRGDLSWAGVGRSFSPETMFSFVGVF